VNNWRLIPTIVLATVLIFGAGVFSGGMLVDYVKQPRPRMVAKRPAPPSPPAENAATNAAKAIRPPEILSKDFLQRLDGELHLTKDQHDAVQKIINEGQNAMRKVVQDARLEIREVLTAEQRNDFDELVKRPFRRPIFPTNAPAALMMATNSSPAPARSP